MAEIMEKKTSWERRGHIRHLKNGREVYVKPAKIHRKSDEERAAIEAQKLADRSTECQHSQALDIEALLEKNEAVAKGNVLEIAKFKTKFGFEAIPGSDFMRINPTLPYYKTGNTNPRWNPKYYKNKTWNQYDIAFETHVVKTLLSFICCAISKYREKPFAARLNFDGYQARTYLKSGQRHIVVGDVDISFKTNDVNSGICNAVRYNANHTAVVNAVAIWACPFAKRVIKLARDIIVLHEHANAIKA